MISGLIDQYPDRFAVITYHVNMDGFDVPWGQNRLNNFYGLAGAVPSLLVDGWWNCAIGDYQYCLAERMSEPTDVTIDLSAEQIDNANWRIFSDICVEASGSSKSIRIYTTAQLDDYPNPPEHSRYTIMQDGMTQDIYLEAGGCVRTVTNITFDEISLGDQSDIVITVWAQAPASAAPAEVFQTAQMAWPFTQAPRLSDISISPTSADLINGEQLSFLAIGTDQFGDVIDLVNPIWSISGTAYGTFDPQAGGAITTFTAIQPGAGEITCSDGSLDGTAVVNIVASTPPNHRWPRRRFQTLP